MRDRLGLSIGIDETPTTIGTRPKNMINTARFDRRISKKGKLLEIFAATWVATRCYCHRFFVSNLPGHLWISVTLLAALLASGSEALAARPIEMFREDSTFPGMRIVFAHSRELGVDGVLYSTNINAKMAYAELSDKDRQTWRSQYEAMPDEDEPPFPVGGLISMLRPIAALASITDEAGVLIIHLEVDSDGKPRKADLLATPTPDFGPKAIASVMSVTYKPAKCRGAPCTMSIPLRVVLIQGGNG
jgi:hypothetical protein